MVAATSTRDTHSPARRPGRGAARPAYLQRHAGGLLVEAHLAPQAVLAEHLAVVAGMYHHGVAGQVQLVERFQELAQLVVGVAHQAVVGGAGAADLLPRCGRGEAERASQAPRRRRQRLQVAGRQVRAGRRGARSTARRTAPAPRTGSGARSGPRTGRRDARRRPWARRRRYASAARHRIVVGVDLRRAPRSGRRRGVHPPPGPGLGLRAASPSGAGRHARVGAHHTGPGLARLRHAVAPRGRSDAATRMCRSRANCSWKPCRVIVADQVHLAGQGHIVSLSA